MVTQEQIIFQAQQRETLRQRALQQPQQTNQVIRQPVQRLGGVWEGFEQAGKVLGSLGDGFIGI